MAKVLYAWSEIRNGDVVLKPGSKVTQDGLKLDDDQWAQLLESSAVRTNPYPDMPETYQGTPIQFLLEQAAAAEIDASGSALDTTPEEEKAK